MRDLYVRHIAALLQVKDWQVENCAELFAEGCTIPFISRYRKERTGGLSDVEVAEIKHWTEVFGEMEKRKASILSTIEEQGKLTPELKAQIEEAQVLQRVEDLYKPFKKKKATRASKAKARGLAPLAEILWEQGGEARLAMTYIYDHLDAFRLLICKSAGTRYESFLHDLSEAEEKITLDMMSLLREQGMPIREVDPEEFHLLVTANIDAVFQAVIHDFSREQAMHYADTLDAFFARGWQALFGY